MRTIAQIKEHRNNGGKRWGRDLFLHLLPWIEQKLTLGEMETRLMDQGLEVNTNQLNQLIFYHRNKLPSPPLSVLAPRVPAASHALSTIAQKQEETPIGSAPGFSDFVPTEHIKKDFRRPLPKPKSVRGE